MGEEGGNEEYHRSPTVGWPILVDCEPLGVLDWAR